MNVVVPLLLTGDVGCVVTLKSAAFVPVIDTFGVPFKVSALVPVFSIVNVCETVPPATLALPKSVSSVALGVVSPSAMDVLLPLTLISGAVKAGQELPVVTPPGVIQLEVLPVSAKLLSVQLAAAGPESVAVVTPVLMPLDTHRFNF